MNYIGEIKQLIKEYPVISGAVSLWGLGVATYLFRELPFKIYNFILRHCTTTLHIESSTTSYYALMNWLKAKGDFKFVRSLKYLDSSDLSPIYDKTGSGKKFLNISIGPGRHLVKLKGRYVYITLTERTTHSDRERNGLAITILGRSTSFFDELFQEVLDFEEKSDLRVYEPDMSFWINLDCSVNRPLDSLYLNDGVLDKLLKFIDDFKLNFDRNKRMHLPNRAGIILEGPAGTGKTSIIKGIATYLQRDLYIATNIQYPKLLSMIPSNTLIAIEDIDCCNLNTTDRESNSKKQDVADSNDQFATLSSLLNELDGLSTKDNKIVVASTNNIEKLDSALIRSGRFDLILRIDYTEKEPFLRFINDFFETSVVLPECFKMKEKVTIADISVKCRELDDIDLVIDYYNGGK